MNSASNASSSNTSLLTIVYNESTIPMYPQNYESGLGFHGNWFISRRENIENHYITGEQTCDLFTPSGPYFDIGCNQCANDFFFSGICFAMKKMIFICASCSCARGCRCDDDCENTNYTHDTVHRPPELNQDTTLWHSQFVDSQVITWLFQSLCQVSKIWHLCKVLWWHIYKCCFFFPSKSNKQLLSLQQCCPLANIFLIFDTYSNYRFIVRNVLAELPMPEEIVLQARYTLIFIWM